jgi:peptidoglycan/LPS O-acetylase OafA/YrhL
LQWIGVVSYGAYVFHAVAITMALKLVTGGLAEGQLLLDEPLWVRLSTFVLAYALTLVMAWVSFEYFEKPVGRLALARKARLQPGT